MIHGTNANCDELGAKQLTNEIDRFNVLLGNFAELGSSVIKASETPTHKPIKSTGHLIAREATKVFNQVKSLPTHSHVDPSDSNHKLDLHHQIQKSYHELSKQQTKLNSLKVDCVPMEHKLHIASQLTSMMNTYVIKDKQIKAAGQHIEEKKDTKKSGGSPRKQKRTSQEKERRSEERRLLRREIVKRSIARETHCANHGVERVKHAVTSSPQQAAWLTMDDGINGGYNNDQDILTASSTSTSSTLTSSTSLPYYTPYAYNSPQLEPQYITITSSGSVEVSSAPSPLSAKGTNATADSDSDSGTDNSDDSSSDDDDDASSSTIPHTNNVSLPTPTSAHHNIIVRTFDGTLHLLTGSLHLVDNVFHKIFLVQDIEKSGSSTKDVVNDKEINVLVNHVKEIYHIKL